MCKKIRKGEKGNAKKIKQKTKSISQNFDFCAWPSKNAVKHNASGKRSMLSCSKYFFE